MTTPVGNEAGVSSYVINLRGRKYFEVIDNRLVFIASEQYKNHFSRSGIGVQPADKPRFEGRGYVKIEDPLFAKALRELYFPRTLRKMGFELVVNETDVPTKEMKNLNITD
jgi:hypothetical protein